MDTRIETHSFALRATRNPHALPRILLTLARRRLSVRSLHVDTDDGPLASVYFSCDVDARGAALLLAQLRRCIDVERALLQTDA